MLTISDGWGSNPYTVNVITFSGHGITFDGDAIAVIPEYKAKPAIEGEKKVLRFINLTEWARKFSEKRNTLTIFILSMCRINVKEADKKKIYFNNVDLDPQEYDFELLLSDQEIKSTNIHEGYSAMLFEK
jgi:hypothetical protein